MRDFVTGFNGPGDLVSKRMLPELLTDRSHCRKQLQSCCRTGSEVELETDRREAASVPLCVRLIILPHQADVVQWQ